MSTIKLEQSFKDEFVGKDYEVSQSVSIDLAQNWVYINHNGEEFSMSLPAYKKFIELNHNAILESQKTTTLNK